MRSMGHARKQAKRPPTQPAANTLSFQPSGPWLLAAGSWSHRLCWATFGLFSSSLKVLAYTPKKSALRAPADRNGKDMPLYKPRTPSYLRVVLSVFNTPICSWKACCRTFIVSAGCPTERPATPPAQPATNSGHDRTSIPRGG